MKITVQWKDPDFCNAKTGEYLDDVIPKEEYTKLHNLGMGEYVQIEFDTDEGTARVLPPKRLW